MIGMNADNDAALEENRIYLNRNRLYSKLEATNVMGVSLMSRLLIHLYDIHYKTESGQNPHSSLGTPS